MSRYERITHLTAETVEVTNLTVNGAPYEAPAKVEALVPPKAPAPLPEKLTMVALAQAHQDLVDTLVTAGLLVPFEGAPEAVEGAE
jgi:hypothetical protein